MIRRYKTKPCEIEAIQWDGSNQKEVMDFVGESLIYYSLNLDTSWNDDKPYVYMAVMTLEGRMRMSKGDYIIKGLRGEFYPCKPDVFEKKYELIEE